MYDRKKIGRELQKELDKGYNVLRISRWAYELFYNHQRELTDELEELLQYLFFMEEDPQFVYSELELKMLAEKLMKGEENSLKQINDLKIKNL